jgi:hypothetical protein
MAPWSVLLRLDEWLVGHPIELNNVQRCDRKIDPVLAVAETVTLACLTAKGARAPIVRFMIAIRGNLVCEYLLIKGESKS